jgi:transcriptional regulator
MAQDRTSIKLSKEVRDRLKAQGQKGESYDELVDRLIDECVTEEVKQ